ncbi:PfaB family protein [Candidatus Chloroploca sp. Khr17]|uniref:PfaB family protein n=1 Tax=Candidatus Chloroploca sp. Khr17 TaxID=2496869 RepID=UPI00101DCD58|nr:PfaB family protein [Candidatus Chloroploca sp. Khr17]
MEPVAIIGLGGLFPGAHAPEAFWRTLAAGEDGTSLLTATELGVDPAFFFDPTRHNSDGFAYARGGFVRAFSFDPHGFALPATMLQGLDPLYTWSLEVARQALRDSGYLGDEARLARCGVILGNLSFPTRSSHRLIARLYTSAVADALRDALGGRPVQLDELPPLSEGSTSNPLNGRISGQPASLIARACGLGSVHYALDAACASSLYALKFACDCLASGKADLMLAGAVSCADPLFVHTGFSIFQAYPPEGGTSRPLDRGSKGLTSGEGAGMVVLKRHADALRDGDRIYGIIRGIGLSNDGAGKHLLVPNPKGQHLAFERAYASAGVSPATIRYVECHATGTPVGDIVELNSMERFFGAYGAAPWLGSVKSNFGHLLTAAGMAGLLKVVLSMQHNQLPPTIGINEPLVSQGGTVGGAGIVQRLTPWPEQAGPRRAGISAFGFGGTNAHLILEGNGEFAEGRPFQIADFGLQIAAYDGSLRSGRTTDDITDKSQATQMPLAIIGMDICLGPYKDRSAFEQGTYAGDMAKYPLPPRRWHEHETHPALASHFGLPGGSAPEGAYLQGFAFDFLRAKIPPDATDQPLAQQLLLLRVADGALRDAQIERGAHVAVIVAMEAEAAIHQLRGRQDLTWQLPRLCEHMGLHLTPEEEAELTTSLKDALHPRAQVNQYLSFIGNIMACRVAALWDLSGPAFTLSADESSATRALETAQTLLADANLEAVVVAAVDLAGSIERILLDPRRTATPLHPGEGAGAVVLKRAEAGRPTPAYATIEAIAVSSSAGRSRSVLPHEPDRQALETAARLALKTAHVTPASIGYLDVHQLTPLPMADFGLEIAAHDAPMRSSSCALGSAQAQVGQTGAVSGMVSLIRTTLALHGRYLPAVTTGASLPSAAQLADTPFYLPEASRPWLTGPGEGRRAAISTLGSDGCASHLVLAEATDRTREREASTVAHYTRIWLVPLVGDHQAELHDSLAALKSTLETGTPLEAIAEQALRSSQVRAEARYSVSLLARTTNELLREVGFAERGVAEAFATGQTWETPLGSYFTPQPLGPHAEVAFVYPGAFSAYPGLGRDLLQLFPGLHERLGALVRDVPELIGATRLYPRYRGQPGQNELDQAKAVLRSDPPGMVQTSLAFTLLFTTVLREYFKLQPTAAFGYSMGEASMLWAMGAWQASDAALAKLRQLPLFTRRLAGRHEAVRAYFGLDPAGDEACWSIYTARVNATQAQARLRGEQRAFLTHINTPDEVVIAGEPATVRAIIADLGCEAFQAPFNTAIHCPAMRSEYDLLVELNHVTTVDVPGIRFYSAATMRPTVLEANVIAHNIARATCQSVDFPQLVQQVYADGARIFIEAGPANACSRWIGTILAGQPHFAGAVNRQGSDDATNLLTLLARLQSQRVALDLTPLLPVRRDEVAGRSLMKWIALGGKGVRGVVPEFFNAEDEPEFFNAEARGRGGAEDGPEFFNAEARGRGGAEDGPKFFNAEARGRGGAEDGPVNVIERHQAWLAERHALLRAYGERLSRQQDATTPISVTPSENGVVAAEAAKAAVAVIWDEAALLEFAGGAIAKVFGPTYASIDQYHRRVRLPLPPYLLVSRVTHLDATCGSFQPSKITTEYDIPPDAWYSVDGQAPTAVAVESGQCDLLLISYLGIDFECRGERVYRLLDCTLTFLDDLPKEGETLRYDISINSFARSGDTLLFFFSYECFVGERMVLKMDGGCAGFFTDSELDHGRGVVDSKDDLEQRRQAVKQMFVPPLASSRRSLSETDLDQLIAGHLEACFGPSYAQGGRNASLRLPIRQMLMLSRIASLDPHGGDWGLGLVIGEQDLTPESWFFPCHFSDDQVMAGSLMAEGCSQLLQIYMLFLGLQTYTFDARFQPVPEVAQVVRCRGQVTPITSTLIYRMEVTALGVEPEPYAYANIDVILEGRIVVRFKDLALKLAEKNPQLTPPRLAEHPAHNEPVAYNEDQLQHFTTGSMVACFGPDYAIFEGRRTPRNPNGDLQLLSRIVHLEGQRGDLRDGAYLIGEYDVPINPWFCHRNSYPTTPYAVLMEIGLQPCGFLTTALGSTLTDPEQDFYFRNLDGSGHLLREVDLRGKRIASRATLRKSNAIAGIIIQTFDFGLSVDGSDFYVGDAAFGFFSKSVLANQTGLDGGKTTAPWLVTSGNQANCTELDLRGDRHPLFTAPPGRPHERLAGGQLNLLDRVLVMPEGGTHGAGYIYGEKRVDPTNWFFPCHFYLDPVMPGSLGVEAISEAVQAYALFCGIGRELPAPHFAPAIDQRTVWKYRGQIIPTTGLMSLEAHITRIEQRGPAIVIVANASLWRDGLRIYEVKDLGIAINAATGNKQ